MCMLLIVKIVAEVIVPPPDVVDRLPDSTN